VVRLIAANRVGRRAWRPAVHAHSEPARRPRACDRSTQGARIQLRRARATGNCTGRRALEPNRRRPSHDGYRVTVDRLISITERVLVRTSSFCTTTSTVVVGDDGGCLLVDPAVTPADIAELVSDLADRSL